MIPTSMREVTKDEFLAVLKAERRDIMPNNDNPTFTEWRVVATRALWGWSYPGWKNPGEAKRWAVAK